ncbi:MAG: leucine--tRNA ligase [Dehalococcoidia bacterium]|nr:leucine--tRNA ligase [Dehalococcoidia bacterium]HCV00821.1 leucine--tRNA ligase [Dehalococcoidia bacterium]|tara:strand:- start:6830 stop:9268 length:2439 start_codon:yes stop_codon:yes gene_type:complete
MLDRYNPHSIETKWRERWASSGIDRVSDADDRPPFYALTMFPYPSGDLHTGHWYIIAPSDAAARFRRMQGYNVLFPIGFDAFGLPAENAAIERGVDPKGWTYGNIDRMRSQLRTMGASFDWDREVITCDTEYYRWTQWWFLKLYERGLAYRSEAAANWCPGCQTVLANEQVIDGLCERSDDPVERRFLTQWFFRITDYAEELLDFEGLDWPEPITTMQRNWIGRSEGATLHFQVDVKGVDEPLTVFTTRPDTVYGATFMVIAPEHPLIETITSMDQRTVVQSYVAATSRASEVERLSTEREKTGVFTGAYAINPFNGARVPIWTADYVLGTYGTGAIMAVPAHDERDFEFARQHGLDVVPVFDHPDIDVDKPLEGAFTNGETMINSEALDGTPANEAISVVVARAEKEGIGTGAITYRLRDWLISRQRYWGAPIPIIHCDDCGVIPVPDGDLPVVLPEGVHFEPTGQSPLTQIEEWVSVKCPQCGSGARRETDTLDTFMCSSWYQMRYVDPHNSVLPFSKEAGSHWLPVDVYTGGAEHAVMHLLYTRFFWKAARDMGIVQGREPMKRLFNQGVILGPDGNRMSKSRGNVVAPDDLVERYGADAFRCQLMFIGPWDQGGPYNPSGMPGIVRWLNRLWTVATESSPDEGDGVASRELAAATHRTIRDVTSDLEGFRFNTAIARLMELTSTLVRARGTGGVDSATWVGSVEALILMTAPLAPHISEELWEHRGKSYSVHQQAWPAFDEALVVEDMVEIVVQVNGKVRDRLTLPADASEEDARVGALASEKVRGWVGSSEPRRVIYVPGKLLNIVV